MGPIRLSVILAAIPVIVWRIHAATGATWLAWVAGGLAASVIAVGLATSLRRNPDGQVGTPPRLAALAGLGAAVALLGSWETLWPCAADCAGGAAYARILGLPAGILAGAVLAVIALISVIQAHRTRINGLAEVLGWACVGASGYFLFLSVELEILCSYCLAVHGVVLTLPAALLAGSGLRPGERLATVVVAALALHALYHPVGGSHDRVVVQGELSVEDLRLFSRADLGRRWGDPQAPLRLELVIDLHCSRCREHFGPLLDRLGPAFAAGSVHLVVRHRFQAGVSGSSRLTPLAIAAAADGRYRDFVNATLGRPADREPGQVDQDLPEPFAHLPALADDFAGAIALLLAADQRQLRLMDAQSAPALLLFQRGRREPIRRWHDQLDPDAVLAAVSGSGRIGL